MPKEPNGPDDVDQEAQGINTENVDPNFKITLDIEMIEDEKVNYGPLDPPGPDVIFIDESLPESENAIETTPLG